MTWRYDSADYNVGDAIFVQSREGWRDFIAKRYKVIRKTPTGIITAKGDRAGEVRITARGRVHGGVGYDSPSVCSKEKAAVLRAEKAQRVWWQLVRDAGNSIEQAARIQDNAALTDAMSDLTAAMLARPDAPEQSS